MGIFDLITGSPDKRRRKEIIKTQKRLWENSDYQALVDYSLDKINDLPAEPVEDGDEEISEIYTWTAFGIWEQTKNRELALDPAIKAYRFNRGNDKVLSLIREINNDYSPDTITFKIMANGLYGQPLKGINKRLPFLTAYIVAAEAYEEALKIIKSHEPADIADNLTIDEYEELEERPDLPKGIYETTGLIFYGENEKKYKKPNNKQK